VLWIVALDVERAVSLRPFHLLFQEWRMVNRQECADVCNKLQPSEDMCGCSTQEAFVRLASLERATTPYKVI